MSASRFELHRYKLGQTISSQGTEWTVDAAGDGRVATPPLPAGDAHFSLTAHGKVRTFIGKKAEPGTLVIDMGDIVLPDEMAVGGIVTDGDGKPASGVEVIPNYDWQNSVKTDTERRFNVHGVGEDLKSLRLQSNDYFAPTPFDVTPGRTDLKLSVIKAYEIHGTAVDAQAGKPVPLHGPHVGLRIRASYRQFRRHVHAREPESRPVLRPLVLRLRGSDRRADDCRPDYRSRARTARLRSISPLPRGARSKGALSTCRRPWRVKSG